MADKLITQLPLSTTPVGADTFILQVASTGITTMISYANFKAALGIAANVPSGVGFWHNTAAGVVDAAALLGSAPWQVLAMNAAGTDVAFSAVDAGGNVILGDASHGVCASSYRGAGTNQPFMFSTAGVPIADVDTTLTQAQYQCHDLYCTGALTAPRNLFLPNAAVVDGGTWRVFNFTAQNITFKPTGGTGLVIAPSVWVTCRIVGTSIVLISTSASGSAYVAPTGTGITHITGGAQDAAASKGTANQYLVTNAGATDAVWTTAAGDWSGPVTANVVAKVNATAVPSLGGAGVTGNAPYVSAASGVTWSALNLAGGAGWVTGTLPVGNQASQTMAGDVTGTTGASVVAKVNATTYPSLGGAGVTGNSPYVSGVSAVTYSALNLAGGAGWVTGLLPTANQASQAMAGDVAGTTAASVVAKVNGATIPAAGALVTGNAPYVSGSSALTYSALNLAGGAGWVTGSLPLGNQAAPTGTGLVKVSAGAWAAAAATLVDADVAVGAAIAVSKLAAGATGTVLIGPGPAFSASPLISGLASIGSIGGYTSQAFGFATLSKSIAGGANVTLSTVEAQNRNITFTGAISADIFAIIPAGTTLVAGSEYTLTNSTTYTAITAAWMVNFKYASGGTGLWLPNGVTVKAVWNGSDFVYGDGSFAGGDLTITQSLISGIASTATALFKVPVNFHLVQVYARQITTMVGGTTTISVGSTSGGQQLLTLGPAGPAGSIAGVTTSGLGSDMASTDGYTHVYTAGTTFWIAQNQTVALSSAGAIQLTFRGVVVPLWEASGEASSEVALARPRGRTCSRFRTSGAAGRSTIHPGFGRTLRAPRPLLRTRSASGRSTISAGTRGTFCRRPRRSGAPTTQPESTRRTLAARSME